MQCNNPDCLYLHELGDEDDSFTKEEMQSGRNGALVAARSEDGNLADFSMIVSLWWLVQRCCCILM